MTNSRSALVGVKAVGFDVDIDCLSSSRSALEKMIGVKAVSFDSESSCFPGSGSVEGGLVSNVLITVKVMGEREFYVASF